MTYIKKDMGSIKMIFHFLDWTFGLFLGLTIIDMVNLFQDNILDFSQVEGTPFQYVYIVGGLVYFGVGIYNKLKKGKDESKQRELENEHDKLENEKLKEELEMLKHENDEKKTES